LVHRSAILCWPSESNDLDLFPASTDCCADLGPGTCRIMECVVVTVAPKPLTPRTKFVQAKVVDPSAGCKAMRVHRAAFLVFLQLVRGAGYIVCPRPAPFFLTIKVLSTL
jgi:hypothetical protein